MKRTTIPRADARGVTATMTAVVQSRFGTDPAAVLTVAEVDLPAIGPDDVLVRVRAASIDRGTWHLMAGLPYALRIAGFGLRRPKYRDPARALSGTVEAVGSSVTDLAPGDEVYGVGLCVLAQYARAPRAKLARKPGVLSFEEAAAVPISGLTAFQAVHTHGRVGAGQRVLVTGASGGVGSFAVQVAAALGGEVTGVASGAKLDMVRALGASDAVDYTSDDLDTQLVTRGLYDVIVDIAGHWDVSRLRRLLTRTGRLVIVGSENSGRWVGGIDRQLRASLLSPFVRQRLGSFVASEKGADLEQMRELLESGRVRAAVDQVYPLYDAVEAMSDLAAGRVRGKAVISAS